MMSRFPLFLQPDAMDCGPAYLKMVAAYSGRNITLQTLRNLAFAGREGTSFLTLIDAAAAIGLKATGARLTVESLAGLPLPAILHWDQKHFVVLYRVKNKKYFIADPASGMVTFREEDFLKHWASATLEDKPAGLAIFMETTPDFFLRENETEKRPGFGFLTAYLRPYRKLLSQLVLGFLTATLISLLLPFLTQAIADKGINGKNPRFTSFYK